MNNSNHAIHTKVKEQLEKYNEDVRFVISKGLEYTLRNNLTYVVNHLRRDIDQTTKGKQK